MIIFTAFHCVTELDLNMQVTNEQQRVPGVNRVGTRVGAGAADNSATGELKSHCGRSVQLVELK